MKRLFCIATVVLTLSLTACGKSQPAKAATLPEPEAPAIAFRDVFYQNYIVDGVFNIDRYLSDLGYTLYYESDRGVNFEIKVSNDNRTIYVNSNSETSSNSYAIMGENQSGEYGSIYTGTVVSQTKEELTTNYPNLTFYSDTIFKFEICLKADNLLEFNPFIGQDYYSYDTDGNPIFHKAAAITSSEDSTPEIDSSQSYPPKDVHNYIQGDHLVIGHFFGVNGYSIDYKQDETGGHFIATKDVIMIDIYTVESTTYIETTNTTGTSEDRIYVATVDINTENRLTTKYDDIDYGSDALELLQTLVNNENEIREHRCPFAELDITHYEKSQDNAVTEHND